MWRDGSNSTWKLLRASRVQGSEKMKVDVLLRHQQSDRTSVLYAATMDFPLLRIYSGFVAEMSGERGISL